MRVDEHQPAAGMRPADCLCQCPFGLAAAGLAHPHFEQRLARVGGDQAAPAVRCPVDALQQQFRISVLEGW